jgi:uncharacterized protein (DUF983 family)
MRLAPLLRQRCPRCGQGRVFGGLVRMNRTCPVCGIAFEREPGYFLGAMYFSYGLAVAAATPVVIAGLALDWSYPFIGTVAGIELVLLAPFLFRYSRVLWMFMDQHFDPRP